MSNVEIPPARTIAISDRVDGTTTANRPAYIRPGETMLFAFDCEPIAGDWIEAADNVTVVAAGTPAGVLVATFDSVRESFVLLNIDAGAAEDGDSWRVLFDAHPTAPQRIKCEFNVVCEDD